MKRSMLILGSFLFMLFLNACGTIFAPPIDTQDGIHESVADLLTFYSLDDFAEAMQEGSSSNTNDIINWAGYDIHYKLSNIPEGFVLGKIIAGSADIMFCYYPIDSVGSINDMMAAEASQSSFELVYRHWELDDPLAEIMKQIGQTADDFIGERYLFDQITDTYYWIEDEHNVCSLHIPKEYSFSQNDISRLCAVIPVDSINQK